MTSHSRCAKDSASCDVKFCLLREQRVLGNVLLKNFVAAAVFSVSYFLNVVDEFRSCLSKPEGTVYYFGLSHVLLHFPLQLFKFLSFMLLLQKLVSHNQYQNYIVTK